MPYLIERQRALRVQEVVVILTGQQRRFRSHLILKDNSLVRTLTRPRTLIRVLAEEYPKPILRQATRKRNTNRLGA